MKKYTIQELLEVFQGDAIISEKNRIQEIEKFKIKYPGVSLPIHLEDEFGIANALACICEELIELRKK